ncbi:peamaclein [Phtheirospermum japonicum]|uniref:Peamaclein n=1 Tax=Phtheirospermum japonicum TaxID=374723 RepID=A0A830B401_9LAMI|nr:peamaclein [Phtheirospermum japonicum]
MKLIFFILLLIVSLLSSSSFLAEAVAVTPAPAPAPSVQTQELKSGACITATYAAANATVFLQGLTVTSRNVHVTEICSTPRANPSALEKTTHHLN